jgi:hypothetical protein
MVPVGGRECDAPADGKEPRTQHLIQSLRGKSALRSYHVEYVDVVAEAIEQCGSALFVTEYLDPRRCLDGSGNLKEGMAVRLARFS